MNLLVLSVGAMRRFSVEVIRTVDGTGILLAGVDRFPEERGCPLAATLGDGVEARLRLTELVCLLLETVGCTNLLVGEISGFVSLSEGELDMTDLLASAFGLFSTISILCAALP